MRIVIDMQGAQSASRTRGIGRYSLAFAQGLIRNRQGHDIILVLNDRFAGTIDPIRRAFRDLIPPENIRVWDAPGPVHASDITNDARRHRAEIVYEAFLASLEPDIVHVTSLFEGFVDDAVTSIGRLANGVRVSVTLYDLIPLHDPERFLDPNPALKAWYLDKLEQLKLADQFLAISEFSANDARQRLGIPQECIVNVSTACADIFHQRPISDSERLALFSRLGINRSFIATSGTIEPHKNLGRLFSAFSRLPTEIRSAHQLVLVGKVLDTQQPVLADMVQRAGLTPDEVVITRYIKDDDLAAIYNLCALMVFPSVDEGFGLPALEAMACGAPTIGSHAASIPEVIGREDALFDPYDEEDMARLMWRALTDKPFQEELKTHSLQRAENFSWDSVARKAVCQMEALAKKEKSGALTKGNLFSACIKSLVEIPMDEAESLALAQSLAWTFPVSAYEKQLLIDVSELVRRDARTGCQRVTRSIVLELLNKPPAGFCVEPVYASLSEPGYRYARAFVAGLKGMSAIGHDEPIDYAPGDIFFGLDYHPLVAPYQEAFLLQLKRSGVSVRFLVYDVLSVTMPQYFAEGNEAAFRRWLHTIAKFDGVIGISKATVEALKCWYILHEESVSDTFHYDWVHLGADIENSMPTFGLPVDAPSILSELRQRPTFLMVGTIEPRKGYTQALAGFDLLWSHGAELNLVIVGKKGWNVELLTATLRRHPQLGRRLFWLEGISDEYLEKIYAAADCLIAASEGEGFGLPLIEAAWHKLPILARDIPVFREVAGGHATWFSGHSAEDLANAVEAWVELYQQGNHPRSDAMPWITWAESARQMTETLGAGTNTNQHALNGPPKRKLFVDVSEVAQRDAKTGCQRVTRSVLSELLKNPPAGFEVIPVYATATERGYRHARNFAFEIAGECKVGIDDPLDFGHGDVFFGLDFQTTVVISQEEYLKFLKRRGVKVYFLVHDILPVRIASYFPAWLEDEFAKWLRTLSKFDGVVCVSKATADDLGSWYRQNVPDLDPDFLIGWAHNGADIENSVPTFGLPDNAAVVLSELGQRPTFLMVGTIEPRKGYAQALAAFETLWARGIDVNFVIVGKEGWNMEHVIKRLRTLPQWGSRLHWLNGISDEYLEKIYANADCLIAASEGEGFGLPLIEAARNNLPILARDLPVFREIAGKHAAWFSGLDAQSLADAIVAWLSSYEQSQHPRSDGMPWITWAESACLMMSAILGKERLDDQSHTQSRHRCLPVVSGTRARVGKCDPVPPNSTVTA